MLGWLNILSCCSTTHFSTIALVHEEIHDQPHTIYSTDSSSFIELLFHTTCERTLSDLLVEFMHTYLLKLGFIPHRNPDEIDA